jgi:predicted DNA-binding transcriptional regulator AlpA
VSAQTDNRRRSKNAIALRRLLAALKSGAIGGIQPIAVRRDAAARLLGMSTDSFDRARSLGMIPKPLRLCGGAVLVWGVAELQRWVAAGGPDCESWETLKRTADNLGQ